MRRPLFRHMLLGACFLAPVLLAGCTTEEGVPQNFPPLRYTYLAPISLSVGSIQTSIAYAPMQDGSSLDSVSPETPLQAVEQMIQDRLVAGGGGGTATVTINTASINRVGDTAVGNISLELRVTSASGRRTGFTNASVTRTRTLPDDTSDAALRAFLYTMTSDLVSAENVELEYQIRRHLAGWLVGGDASPVIGGPAVPAPVEAEPLGGPGAPEPMTGSPMPPGAPMPLGAPVSAPVPMAMPPASMPSQTMPGMPMPAQGMPSQTMPGMPMPAQGMPSQTMPGMPMSPQPVAEPPTPTMPGGALGLPEGNPVPPDLGTQPDTGTEAPAAGTPVPLTSAPTYSASPNEPGSQPAPTYQLTPTPTPAPTPAPPPTPAPAPPPPSSSGALPPLPATITP